MIREYIIIEIDNKASNFVCRYAPAIVFLQILVWEKNNMQLLVVNYILYPLW